jgi:pimeloyl-ACP methyl ester carboxylesterase
MNFVIQSREGLPIRGNLDAPEKPRALVVAVHGFKGFKDWGFFPWLAQRLTGHGLAVCRFNMSRCGIGEEPEAFDRLDLFEDDTYGTQLNDLASAVAFAQQQFPSLPVFLLGHSRGSGVAILGASGVERLKGVIAWSPISHVDRWDATAVRDWNERGFTEAVNARTKQMMRMSRRMLDEFTSDPSRFDVRAATRQLEVPLLVIHGAKDESVPVAEGRELAAIAPQGSIAVIERASHTFNAIHPLVDLPFPLTLAAELSAHFANAWAARETALPAA